MKFSTDESLLNIIEMHRTSSKVKVKDEFVHYEVEILEKGENYYITRSYVDKYRYSFYSIFYKINNQVFHTISTTAAMEKGYSILTTKEIVPVDNVKRNTLDNPLYFSLFSKKKEVMVFVQIFMNYLKNLPLSRVRIVSGNYKWFFQDAETREEILLIHN